MVAEMKTFYSCKEARIISGMNNTKHTDEDKKVIIRLKDLIINDIHKDIPNFYAPDFRFFLLPLVWDESGKSVHCEPQENLETLADLGNIVLSSNNSRELSDKNQVIFSADSIYGYLNIFFMGIVFDKKAELTKSVIRNMKTIVRKSSFNKLVKAVTDIDKIIESIDLLLVQLKEKIEGIVEIYGLVNYRSKELIDSTDVIELNNDKLNIQLQKDIQIS